MKTKKGKDKKRTLYNMFSLFDNKTLKQTLKEYLRLQQVQATDEQMDIVEKVCLREFKKGNFWKFIYELPEQFKRDVKAKLPKPPKTKMSRDELLRKKREYAKRVRLLKKHTNPDK